LLEAGFYFNQSGSFLVAPRGMRKNLPMKKSRWKHSYRLLKIQN